MQASGIGGQGLKPLPSQSYHQIAVGAYVGLSSPLTLSLSQPRSPHLALLLARFVRIHDLNSIAFYLPSWGPGVVDDGIAEIRGSGVFPPLLSLSLYIYMYISYLSFPSSLRFIFVHLSRRCNRNSPLRRGEFYLASPESSRFCDGYWN